MEYETVLRELRSKARTVGQAALAREIGVTAQLMCDVLAERRPASAKMLEHLGIKRKHTYVRERDGK